MKPSNAGNGAPAAANKKKTSFSGLACWRIREEQVESPGGGPMGVEIEAVASVEMPKPAHLVVFVNGIIGSPSNWKFAAKQFVRRYPEAVLAHCSQCNTSMLTFDGVDIMGERLAEEVISITNRKPELQKISFVAHSLGGLIARYAIGKLYAHHIREENGEDHSLKLRDQSTEEGEEGTIAGLQPVNFITFATPHAGSRGHRQIPMSGGVRILEKMAFRASWITGRTGKHLFLRDNEEGQPPLLLQMVSDWGNLKFKSALQSFRRRVAYSNSCFDYIVGWGTASIRHHHELPKLKQLPKNVKYPHVINVEEPKATSLQEQHPLKIEINSKNVEAIEEAIITNLAKLGWERIDVSFRKSIQRLFAHTTIQVKSYWMNSDGADVVLHMIDNFLL